MVRALQRKHDERYENKCKEALGGSEWVSMATVLRLMGMMATMMKPIATMDTQLDQKRKAEAKRNEEFSRLQSLERKVLELLKKAKQARRIQEIKQMKEKLKVLEKEQADREAAKVEKEIIAQVKKDAEERAMVQRVWQTGRQRLT